jgi:hypothetical protein
MIKPENHLPLYTVEKEERSIGGEQQKKWKMVIS